jgi:hypothetical protein
MRNREQARQGNDEPQAENKRPLMRSQRLDSATVHHNLFAISVRQTAPFSQNRRAACRER